MANTQEKVNATEPRRNLPENPHGSVGTMAALFCFRPVGRHCVAMQSMYHQAWIKE